MYEVSIVTQFSAAHHLPGYPGACASPHGHNWEVEVFVRGPKLDRTGILEDFRKLKKAVRAVIERIDHSNLNALATFRKMSPTSENIARVLFERLSAKLNAAGHRVSRVTVCETPGSRASYWEEDEA